MWAQVVALLFVSTQRSEFESAGYLPLVVFPGGILTGSSYLKFPLNRFPLFVK